MSPCTPNPKEEVCRRLCRKSSRCHLQAHHASWNILKHLSNMRKCSDYASELMTWRQHLGRPQPVECWSWRPRWRGRFNRVEKPWSRVSTSSAQRLQLPSITAAGLLRHTQVAVMLPRIHITTTTTTCSAHLAKLIPPLQNNTQGLRIAATTISIPHHHQCTMQVSTTTRTHSPHLMLTMSMALTPPIMSPKHSTMRVTAVTTTTTVTVSSLVLSHMLIMLETPAPGTPVITTSPVIVRHALGLHLDATWQWKFAPHFHNHPAVTITTIAATRCRWQVSRARRTTTTTTTILPLPITAAMGRINLRQPHTRVRSRPSLVWSSMQPTTTWMQASRACHRPSRRGVLSRPRAIGLLFASRLTGKTWRIFATESPRRFTCSFEGLGRR
mmetsp:Transcript_20784/g.47790  ORF Transcript_20784/g.47790 Transcript_20784/m.47790 type:complete len:385 (-) Transcript_20784:901-2055(-)